MADLNHLEEQLSQLTLQEVIQLVQRLVARAGGTAAASGGLVSVVLTSCGYAKINVIKVIRELTTLGLKEAKDLADGAPSVIREGLPEHEAEVMVRRLIEAGGSAQIRR